MTDWQSLLLEIKDEETSQRIENLNFSCRSSNFEIIRQLIEWLN